MNLTEGHHLKMMRIVRQGNVKSLKKDKL